MKVPGKELEDDEPVHEARASVYRAATARANYLGQDRPECQFATKEACRGMSCPTEGTFKGLKRLGRFIEGKKRLVMRMPFQGNDNDDGQMTMRGVLWWRIREQCDASVRILLHYTIGRT